jgi:hypothetical protein
VRPRGPGNEDGCEPDRFTTTPFSYPEPILRAVNGARQGALAKSISNWHLIGHNEGCCSNTGYILLPCFYGIRLWIWPEPLVAPRVRRALGTRMLQHVIYSKHVNWLKVWNFHLSQIIFSRIQQQNIPHTSSLSSGAVACGEAIKNGRKIIASQTQRACHAGCRRRGF